MLAFANLLHQGYQVCACGRIKNGEKTTV